MASKTWILAYRVPRLCWLFLLYINRSMPITFIYLSGNIRCRCFYISANYCCFQCCGLQNKWCYDENSNTSCKSPPRSFAREQCLTFSRTLCLWAETDSSSGVILSCSSPTCFKGRKRLSGFFLSCAVHIDS